MSNRAHSVSRVDGGSDTPQPPSQTPRSLTDQPQAVQSESVSREEADQIDAAAAQIHQQVIVAEMQELVQRGLERFSDRSWVKKPVDFSRYVLLSDAFNQADWFFVCAHQLLCVHTGNAQRAAAVGVTGKHHAGLGLLAMIINMPLNDQPSPQGLAHLAAFPANWEELAQRPFYKKLIQRVIVFIEWLGDCWSRLFEICQNRGYPPFQAEQEKMLLLPSPVLQKLIFSCIQRNIEGEQTREQAARGLQVFDDNTARRNTRKANRIAELTGKALLDEIRYFGARYTSARAVEDNSSPPSRTNTTTASSSSAQHTMAPPNAAMIVWSNTPQSTTQPSVASGSSPSSQFDPHLNTMSYDNRQTQSSSPSVANYNQAPSRTVGQQPLARTASVPLNPILASQINARIPRPVQPSVPQSANQTSQQSPRRFSQVQNATVLPAGVATKRSSLLIPPAGYEPIERLNPDTNRVALHQAHLKSPRLEKINMAGQSDPGLRLYQYVVGFCVGPIIVEPSTCWSPVEFDVEPSMIAHKPTEVAPTFESRAARIVEDQTLLFRLRMVAVSPGTTQISESEWVTKDTYWSPSCFIVFNDKHMELRRKLHHHKDLPLDVTSVVKAGKNELTVSFLRNPKDTSTTRCAFAVEVVRVADPATVSSLVTNLSAPESLRVIIKSMMPAPKSKKRHSKASQKPKPNGTPRGPFFPPSSESDNDSDSSIEILDAHISIDLIDPFAATLITLPARGKICTHRECFDLDTFLSTRRSRPSQDPSGPTNPDEWKCPICGRDARPQSLLVDSFLKGVRDEMVLTVTAMGEPLDTIRAVLVHPDGSVKLKPLESSRTRNGSGAIQGGSRQKSTSLAEKAVINLG